MRRTLSAPAGSGRTWCVVVLVRSSSAATATEKTQQTQSIGLVVLMHEREFCLVQKICFEREDLRDEPGLVIPMALASKEDEFFFVVLLLAAW